MTEKSISVAIISLGTELTRGDVQESHLSFLGKELRRLGLYVSMVTILPDNREAACSALVDQSEEYRLIIVTGGLGPTSDDITREAVSDAAGACLEFNVDIWESIKRRFSGRVVSESNRKQALVPRGFVAIENTRGTACGFIGKIRESTIVVLPGPPLELQTMFAESVLPILERDKKTDARESLDCSIFLVGESLIEDEFIKAIRKDVGFHTRLEKDRVVIRLEGGIPESREEVFEHFSRVFGSLVVRRENLSSAEILSSTLLRKGSTIVFAESCTGGLLSEWLTDVPGSSKVFWGGFIVYSNEAKSRILGLDYTLIEKKGAVSEEVAAEMAQHALDVSGADYSIALTGIAGPDGGTPAKPVGTVWLSIGGRGREPYTRCFHFSGSRDRVRRKAATCGFLIAESFISGNVSIAGILILDDIHNQ